MAALLWSEAYWEPVLEGFIASIGGLDGQLRSAVLEAIAGTMSGAFLCQFYCAVSLDACRHFETGGLIECCGCVEEACKLTHLMMCWYIGSKTGDELREQLATSFVAVWRKHANSSRLSLPLLRTASLLYDDCAMHRLPPAHHVPGEAVCLQEFAQQKGPPGVQMIVHSRSSFMHHQAALA